MFGYKFKQAVESLTHVIIIQFNAFRQEEEEEKGLRSRYRVNQNEMKAPTNSTLIKSV